MKNIRENEELLSSARSSRDSFGQCFLIFCLGLSSFYNINVVGSLPVSEAVLCFIFVVYLARGEGWQIPYVRWSSVLIMVWLITQVITDRIRDIPLDDSLRGFARIAAFGAALVSLWYLMAFRIKRIGAFHVGLSGSIVVMVLLFPNEYMLDAPWKFAYGPALTLFVVGLLCWFEISSRWIWFFVLLCLGCVHFLLNSRSLGGGCLMPAFLLLGGSLWNKINYKFRLLISATMAFLLLFIYGVLAGSGELGEESRSKYEMQKSEDGSFVSIITSGRSEHRASFKAISDSPFLGYGSWARHPEYYTYLLSDEDIVNKRQIAAAGELGIIPSHSHIMGAWVDGGPIPGLLWVFVTIILLVRYLKINVVPNTHALFALFLGVGLLWGIVFSPLGVGQRISTAAGFVVIFSAPLLGRNSISSVRTEKHLL